MSRACTAFNCVGVGDLDTEVVEGAALAGVAFELSQPTISHHLKVLHESGLLDREKRGVWVYYRARAQTLASLGALIGYPATSSG